MKKILKIIPFREVVTPVAARFAVPVGRWGHLLVALAAGLLMSFVWCASGLSAQGRTQLPPDCIKYLSYYQEDYKLKDYDRALPNWRKAFAACPPKASQNMYIHGSALYTKLIGKTKDKALREALVDTLLTLQDLRAENYPAKLVSILNNKGTYMVNYRGGDYAYLYENLLPLVSELGNDTSPTLLVNLMESSVKLLKAGSLGADDVLETYALSSGILEGRSMKGDAGEVEAVEKAASAVDGLFAASDVASCGDLVAIYGPKLEADPSNVTLSSTVLRVLGQVDGCQDNDLYLRAATTLHGAAPSARSAYALYRMYAAKEDGGDEALGYIEQAVSLSDEGSAEYERMSYELAQAAYKDGQRGKAYDAARRVAAMDNGYSGKAYLLLGNLWASAQASGEVDRYARFWVAADYYRKAKEADVSLKEEADAQLASVSRYYPEASEMFMYDLAAGQGYSVSCGGMSARTTVRTRN